MSSQTRRGSITPTASRLPWRSRIVEHADVAPERLLAHPLNFRRHPAAQRRSLTAVLGDVGWVARVIVNRRNDRVVDGHARVEEAIARGEATVPVTFVDLDEDEERLILATFDTIGSLAEADPAALTELLAQLSTADADLAELLETLAASAGTARVTGLDPDSVPARPDAATYVHPGDCWKLGPHRILCGDALDPVAVSRLLGGERPTLLVTDPPYGIELNLARRHALAGPTASGTSRRAGHRGVRLTGDERADWSAAFELVPSLAVGYVWHPTLRVAEVVAGLERIGFELVSEIVWLAYGVGRGAKLFLTASRCRL